MLPKKGQIRNALKKCTKPFNLELMETKPRLFVTGRIQADDILLRFPNRIPVITLRGPRDPSLKEPRLAKLHLEVVVDDIQEPVDGGILPSRKHALAILGAWKKCCSQGTKVVILHCEAGISRSTASALVYRFIKTFTDVQVTRGHILFPCG